MKLPDDLPDTWAADIAIKDLPITDGLLYLIQEEPLKELVQEALDNNPDLVATALRLKAAGYFLSGSRSIQLPKVNAEFAKERSNQAVDVQTGNRSTKNSHRMSLGVSWEIDLWGRLRMNMPHHKTLFTPRNMII